MRFLRREGSSNQSNEPRIRERGLRNRANGGEREGSRSGWRTPGTGRLDWPGGMPRVRATAWQSWHYLFFANKNFPPRSLASGRAQRTLRDADPHCWRKRGAMTSPRAYRATTRTARIDAGRCDDHPSSSPRRQPPWRNDNNRPRKRRTRARAPIS